MPDTTPPELFGLTFTPTTVNTSTGPQVVTVTVAISDPDSGVSDAQLRFRSPSANQLADAWFDATHRIAGDEFKGEYQTSVTIPQFGEQGIWEIDYVLLRDQATNFQWLYTADIQNLGFPTSLSQQGPGDTSPPDLVDLAFKPPKINTSKTSQTVTVRVRLTDKPAGVDSAQLRFRSPSGQLAHVWFDAAHLVGGDEFDGEYVETVTFPRFSEQGTWTVEYVLVRDRASNFRWIYTADLQAKGFPVDLAQVGKGDTTAPSLVDLQFWPTTISTAQGGQSVTVRVHVTDKPAGVESVQLRFRSPSGGQLADMWFDTTHLVTGDEHDGEYENTVTIPQHAEQGLWLIGYVLVRDRATNFNWLYTPALQGAGFAVALSVT